MPSDPPSVCVFTHTPSSVISAPAISNTFRPLCQYSVHLTTPFWVQFMKLVQKFVYNSFVHEIGFRNLLPPAPTPPHPTQVPGCPLSILVIVVPFKCTVFIPIKRMIQPSKRKLNSGNLWVDPTLSKSPPILG